MLNTSWTPSYTEILNAAKEIYKETLDDDSVLEYLAEVASYDHACPDKCDQCAVDFFNENEEEIYGK